MQLFRKFSKFHFLIAFLAFVSTTTSAWADTGMPSEVSSDVPTEVRGDGDKERKSIVYGYLSGSQIDFGATRQNWSIVGGGAVLPLGETGTANVEASRETRLTAHYSRFSARYEAGSENALRYYVEGAIGSGASIRENWSISVGGSRKLNEWAAITLDMRFARYDLAATQGGASTKTATPGFRLNPKGSGIELAGKWINFWDRDNSHQQGYSLAGAYYYGDANYVFAGLARYPETDTGITRTMRSVHAGIRHVVCKQLSFRFTAEQLVRKGSYRQRGLTFGLELRL